MDLSEFILAIIVAAGIPSAVTALLIRRFEKRAEQREAAQEEREKNREKMYFMMAQNGRATYIVAKATATAVQRIPDAHCNGDMTSALEQAEKLQKEEQQFLMNQGFQHIFGE